MDDLDLRDEYKSHFESNYNLRETLTRNNSSFITNNSDHDITFWQ